jgi:hypothetical protein
LLAKLLFNVADHSGGFAVAELFRQDTAFGELFFNCLFFAIPFESLQATEPGFKCK